MRVALYFLAVLLLIPAILSVAFAQDAPRHDRRIEKAAAERASRFLGDIRGTIDPGTSDVMHEEKAPRDQRLGFPVIPERKKKPDGELPPVVMLLPIQTPPRLASYGL